MVFRLIGISFPLKALNGMLKEAELQAGKQANIWFIDDFSRFSTRMGLEQAAEWKVWVDLNNLKSSSPLSKIAVHMLV